jgi:hypothetical protein
MDEPVDLEELVDRVTRRHPEGDVLVHLSEAVSMSDVISDVADQLVGHFVDAARTAGVTWAEIGRTMGVSRQAVQKRFVPRSAAVGGLDAAAFDRFTPRARAVVAASQDEARAAGHDYLGTEHIVLGLLSQPEGLAGKFLAEKTTPEQLRAAVSEVLGPRRDNVPEQIPFTSRGKRALELSLQEAQRLGHDYVGTEHLLLGVLAEQHGIGGQVLIRLGVDGRDLEEWLSAQ